MQTLDQQQLEDLIRGCTILGTGGGWKPHPGTPAHSKRLGGR